MALVLKRKLLQRIRIGNNVVIEVRKIRGREVSLAIKAPREIPVVREELEPLAAQEANA